ncbi:MAG: sodium:solute symporter family protein [Planctomycetota bacterium]
MTLTALDFAIIGGYFLLTLVIGLYFTRRAGSSVSEFFISGRSLPWWIAGTSMVATTFASDTPLAVTGLVVKNGLAGNWFWWAFALGGMFTVFVYARMWRRSEVMTDVELIKLRYGGPAADGLRYLRACYVALIVNPIIIGWVVGAMITVLKETVFFTGEAAAPDASMTDAVKWSWFATLGMLAIVGIYCTMSGMWGVAVSDAIQFCLAMAGCIWLAVIAVQYVGGVDELVSKVESSYGSSEAFSFLPNFSAENPWMPLHIFLIMMCLQWWATWYPGSEPGGGGYIVQRMASCKDERNSVLATLWYQIAYYCIRPWPWIIVSFVALAIYPQLRAGYLADSSFDPGVGFPMIMRDLCPPGLAGLMLVAFFAAFMSTISTQMNWGASYLVRDFAQPLLLKDADEKQLARWSRALSIFVLVEGIVAAWFMQGISVDTAWKILAALGAGTGLVFMLRWFWWRINSWSEISAMLASLFFFVAFNFELFGGQAAGGLEAAKLTMAELIFGEMELASEVIMAIVALLTIIVWLIVTMLTPPESDETLSRFYRKVRPDGPGWGPVSKRESDIKPDGNLGISILGAFAGAGIVFLTLPAIGYLIFGQYGLAAVTLAGAAVCAVVVSVVIKKLF